MGTFHEAVWYFVVQKTTNLKDGPLLWSIHNTKTFMEKVKLKLKSKSVRQVIVKGDYIVMSRSLHRLNRKFNDILTKNLYSRKEELGRQSRRELSNERVASTSRSDSPK